MKKKIRDINIDDDFEEGLVDDKEDDLDEDDLSDDELFKDDLGFDDYGGGYSPPIEKHADLLKKLTNFAPYLKETVNGWLGLVWDQKKNTYTPSKDIKPIMNSICAGWCISYLKTYTRENNIITHIGKYEYKYLVEDIIDTIWLNIGLRAKEFGIKNNGDILRICTELQHAAELTLMGAGDGRYNTMLGTVTQRTENITSPQRMENEIVKQQQMGNLDKIRNFLSGK